MVRFSETVTGALFGNYTTVSTSTMGRPQPEPEPGVIGLGRPDLVAELGRTREQCAVKGRFTWWIGETEGFVASNGKSRSRMGIPGTSDPIGKLPIQIKELMGKE